MLSDDEVGNWWWRQGEHQTKENLPQNLYNLYKHTEKWKSGNNDQDNSMKSNRQKKKWNRKQNYLSLSSWKTYQCLHSLIWAQMCNVAEVDREWNDTRPPFNSEKEISRCHFLVIIVSIVTRYVSFPQLILALNSIGNL